MRLTEFDQSLRLLTPFEFYGPAEGLDRAGIIAELPVPTAEHLPTLDVVRTFLKPCREASGQLTDIR